MSAPPIYNCYLCSWISTPPVYNGRLFLWTWKLPTIMATSLCMVNHWICSVDHDGPRTIWHPSNSVHFHGLGGAVGSAGGNKTVGNSENSKHSHSLAAGGWRGRRQNHRTWREQLDAREPLCKTARLSSWMVLLNLQSPMGGHFVAVDTHRNCKQTRPLTYGLKGEGKECKRTMPLTYALESEEQENTKRWLVLWRAQPAQ